MSQTAPPPLMGPVTWIFLSVSVCMLGYISRVWLFSTPWTVAHQTVCPWDSLGKNTGLGTHSLLQGIFPTQGSHPHLWVLCIWQAGSLPVVPTRKPPVARNSASFFFTVFPVWPLELSRNSFTRTFTGKKNQRMNRWMDFWAQYPDTVFLNVMTVINKETEGEKILMLSLSHKVYLT